MVCRGHSGRGGCGWTERSSLSDRTRPASASRHPAAKTGPLLEYPDAVPQLSRKLEVLAFDRTAQLRLQLAQAAARIVAHALARHLVPLADVLARAVQPPQQIAQVGVERHVALVTTEAAGIAEVSQRAAARRATQRVA